MVSFRFNHVRIVAVPPGEAPEKIREQWVGLVLPLSPNFPPDVQSGGSGIFSGIEDPAVGYVIEIEDAISALAKKSPASAAWWREHAAHLFSEGGTLLFDEEVCELVAHTEDWGRP